MKTRLAPLLALAIVLLFGACTTVPDVETKYSPTQDFSSVKTFAVLPMPPQVSGAAPDTMVSLAGPAKQAIIEEMTAKGFREAPEASADILVGLHGELLPRTQIIDPGLTYTGDVWTRGYPYQAQPVVRNYDQGTLAIEIFRNTPTKDELVWVGWSTKKRAPGAPVNPDRVVEGIREILADFPPEK